MPHGGYRTYGRDERNQRGGYNRQANADESYFGQENFRQQPDFDRQNADRSYGYEYNQPDDRQSYDGMRGASRRFYAGQGAMNDDGDIYGEQYGRQRSAQSGSYGRARDFETNDESERGSSQPYDGRRGRQTAGQFGYGRDRYAQQRDDYADQRTQAYGQLYGQYDRGREGYGQFDHGASQQQPDQNFEPDYLRWREEQLGGYDRQFQEWRRTEARKYDTEYTKWRQERQDKFNRDFADWRKSLETKSGAGSGAAGALHATKDDDKSKAGRTTTM